MLADFFHRKMVPFMQYDLGYRLKALLGNVLPALLVSDEALMQLVGFNAHQMRYRLCQSGTAKRQGKRAPGPIWPDTLAKNTAK